MFSLIYSLKNVSRMKRRWREELQLLLPIERSLLSSYKWKNCSSDIGSFERYCALIFAASVQVFFLIVNHSVSIVPSETCLLSDWMHVEFAHLFITHVVSSYFGSLARRIVMFIWKRLSLWVNNRWMTFGFIKFLLFLQEVLKLHCTHVVEQDVFSCFIWHGWGCTFFYCSFEVVYFLWPCFSLSTFHTC